MLKLKDRFTCVLPPDFHCGIIVYCCKHYLHMLYKIFHEVYNFNKKSEREILWRPIKRILLSLW